MNVPLAQNGEFEPKIIGKYSRNADRSEENRALRLWHALVGYCRASQNLYDVEISSELANKISEKIMLEIYEWKSTTPMAVQPFVFILKGHKRTHRAERLWSKDVYLFCLDELALPAFR